MKNYQISNCLFDKLCTINEYSFHRAKDAYDKLVAINEQEDSKLGTLGLIYQTELSVLYYILRDFCEIYVDIEPWKKELLLNISKIMFKE